MIKFSFVHLIPILVLSFMANQLQATDVQVSKSPNSEELKQLKSLKPTIEQIKNVDVKKMPWGLNLCLVEERRNNARKLTIDSDFSTRVSLLQLHKVRAQELSVKLADLSKNIAKKVQETHAKVDSLNVVTRFMNKKKIEEESEAEVKKMLIERNQIIKDVRDNQTLMTMFSQVIKSQTDINDEQISALPDMNKWKIQKKTQCPSSQNPTVKTEAAKKEQVQSPPRPRTPLPPR